MNSLESSPSFIEPDDDVTTSMTQAERMEWMEGKWNEEMGVESPAHLETKTAKMTGKSVLDVAFRGEGETESAPERDFGEFRPIKFEAKRADETDEEFEKRRKDRERRKMFAALTYGPDAMFEEDFETSDKNTRKSMRNTMRTLATESSKEFEEDARQAIEKIETPMDREGFEGIFDKIGQDRPVLEIIYYATQEAWKDLPSAHEKDLDIVGQKELGRVAVEAFYKKYKTAADLRALEREFSENPRFHGPIEPTGNLDLGEEYDGKEKYDVFEDALDRLGETIYGQQEKYMRVAEDLRATAREAASRAAESTTPAPTEKPKSEEKPSEKPVEEPAEETITSAPDVKIETTESSETEETPETPEVPEVKIESPAPSYGYSARVATRRFRTGGYTLNDYGYSGTRLFSDSVSYSKPFTRKFNTPAPTPETAPKKKSSYEKLTKEEFEKYRDLLAKANTLGGSPWHAVVNGVRQSFQAYAANYIQSDLGPFAKLRGMFGGKKREIAASKPFELGEKRTAMIVYYIDDDKVSAKTLVREGDSDFQVMEKYTRSLDMDKHTEGRIDWDKTAEEFIKLEDEQLSKALGDLAREEKPISLGRGDPEFYAAGTAEHKITLS